MRGDFGWPNSLGVERAPDKCEVVGSNPTWAKIFFTLGINCFE